MYTHRPPPSPPAASIVTTHVHDPPMNGQHYSRGGALSRKVSSTSSSIPSTPIRQDSLTHASSSPTASPARSSVDSWPNAAAAYAHHVEAAAMALSMSGVSSPINQTRPNSSLNTTRTQSRVEKIQPMTEINTLPSTIHHQQKPPPAASATLSALDLYQQQNLWYRAKPGHTNPLNHVNPTHRIVPTSVRGTRPLSGARTQPGIESFITLLPSTHTPSNVIELSEPLPSEVMARRREDDRRAMLKQGLLTTLHGNGKDRSKKSASTSIAKTPKRGASHSTRDEYANDEEYEDDYELAATIRADQVTTLPQVVAPVTPVALTKYEADEKSAAVFYPSPPSTSTYANSYAHTVYHSSAPFCAASSSQPIIPPPTYYSFTPLPLRSLPPASHRPVHHSPASPSSLAPTRPSTSHGPTSSRSRPRSRSLTRASSPTNGKPAGFRPMVSIAVAQHHTDEITHPRSARTPSRIRTPSRPTTANATFSSPMSSLPPSSTFVPLSHRRGPLGYQSLTHGKRMSGGASAASRAARKGSVIYSSPNYLSSVCPPSSTSSSLFPIEPFDPFTSEDLLGPIGARLTREADEVEVRKLMASVHDWAGYYERKRVWYDQASENTANGSGTATGVDAAAATMISQEEEFNQQIRTQQAAEEELSSLRRKLASLYTGRRDEAAPIANEDQATPSSLNDDPNTKAEPAPQRRPSNVHLPSTPVPSTPSPYKSHRLHLSNSPPNTHSTPTQSPSPSTPLPTAMSLNDVQIRMRTPQKLSFKDDESNNTPTDGPKSTTIHWTLQPSPLVSTSSAPHSAAPSAFFASPSSSSSTTPANLTGAADIDRVTVVQSLWRRRIAKRRVAQKRMKLRAQDERKEEEQIARREESAYSHQSPALRHEPRQQLIALSPNETASPHSVQSNNANASVEDSASPSKSFVLSPPPNSPPLSTRKSHHKSRKRLGHSPVTPSTAPPPAEPLSAAAQLRADLRESLESQATIIRDMLVANATKAAIIARHREIQTTARRVASNQAFVATLMAATTSGMGLRAMRGHGKGGANANGTSSTSTPYYPTHHPNRASATFSEDLSFAELSSLGLGSGSSGEFTADTNGLNSGTGEEQIQVDENGEIIPPVNDAPPPPVEKKSHDRSLASQAAYQPNMSMSSMDFASMDFGSTFGGIHHTSDLNSVLPPHLAHWMTSVGGSSEPSARALIRSATECVGDGELEELPKSSEDLELEEVEVRNDQLLAEAMKEVKRSYHDEEYARLLEVQREIADIFLIEDSAIRIQAWFRGCVARRYTRQLKVDMGAELVARSDWKLNQQEDDPNGTNQAKVEEVNKNAKDTNVLHPISPPSQTAPSSSPVLLSPHADYERRQLEATLRARRPTEQDPVPVTLCASCQSHAARWSCSTCAMSTCHECDAEIHLPQELRTHQREPAECMMTSVLTPSFHPPLLQPHESVIIREALDRIGINADLHGADDLALIVWVCGGGADSLQYLRSLDPSLIAIIPASGYPVPSLFDKRGVRRATELIDELIADGRSGHFTWILDLVLALADGVNARIAVAEECGRDFFECIGYAHLSPSRSLISPQSPSDSIYPIPPTPQPRPEFTKHVCDWCEELHAELVWCEDCKMKFDEECDADVHQSDKSRAQHLRVAFNLSAQNLMNKEEEDTNEPSNSKSIPLGPVTKPTLESTSTPVDPLSITTQPLMLPQEDDALNVFVNESSVGIEPPTSSLPKREHHP